MLSLLVRFSVRYHGVVIGLATLLMLYGLLEISSAGLDIFPEFSPKQVVIQTESPGFSAEQVEILVTQPIENVVTGLIGLRHIRSESIQGLSIITLIFRENTDIYRNRQMVTERLASVSSELPPGIGPPVPVPLSSSSATILTIGLTSEKRSLMELRDLVDGVMVPRILAAAGVADVNVFGGEIRQLQIQIRPEALKRYGLSIQEVTAAAQQAAGTLGAGFVENSNQRITLQSSGKSLSVEDLRNVILSRQQGANITFADVANVVMAAEAPIGAAAVNGEEGIVMMVIGQYGANTLTVSRAVEQTLQEFDQILSRQEIVLYPDLFRPANYIETSLRNITGHLLLGGVFVVVILLLFLFNLRTAVISAVAIPLSLISACILLLELGVNLNIMVLGGLAIALGEVVDDAIIDTENIFRRLRENRLLETPISAARVVFNASMEVRSSVVYASFIVALVFVPLLTLSGVAGRLFSPLGFSYILAILMSLLVALTVTPAMCYLLLQRSRLSERDPPLIRAMKPLYGSLLKVICRQPAVAVAISIICCVIGLSVLPGLGGQFLPELREGHYIVHTSSVPGTSLQESLRIGGRLTEQFLQIPGVRSVSQWAGRAERGADTYGSHYSEYEVDLEPMGGTEQQAVIDALRDILDDFPGILYEANTFLIERVDETISGYTAPVVVNIYGNDLNKLDGLAQQMAEVIRSVPGATDVQVRSPPGTPLLEIQLQPQQLLRWGVRPLDALEALQIAYEGRVTGKNYLGNRVYDIAVTLDPALKKNITEVGKLPVKTLDGAIIELEKLALITQTSGRYNILHQGAQRIQTVTAHVSGGDLRTFMQQIRLAVHEQIQFDADTYPEFTGAAIEEAQASQQLILHSVLAGIGVLVLIYIAIGSFRHSLLVLVNLPFSLVGGVMAVLFTGGVLSVGSMVGFVTLFGITVRNSIMMVSHYQHLVEVEGESWDLHTVIRGAQERLPSILMTALVTALAMMPIAFDSDNPGREIMGPMAAIIIGGLASSTLLNLLILPAIMLNYGKFDGRKDRLL